jgi:hypothetical protein
MSNPKHPAGAEVDPSERSIDEGLEQQQNYRAADDEDENSARPEVDPSEEPV